MLDTNKIIIVRMIDTLEDPIAYLKQSYKDKTEQYYIVSNDDKQVVSKNKNLQCMVVFVVFKPDDEHKKDEVLKLFVGSGSIKEKESGWRIYYNIHAAFSSELIINNFISNSEIDLKRDFGRQSYVLIEDNVELVKQMAFMSFPPYKVKSIPAEKQEYRTIKRENFLREYSQKNEHCKRPLGIQSSQGCDAQEQRSEYQRDYERIIHAKAYRRLVDKAQIFTSSKGDHYRTRMTHTLEVAQIARGIARGLNLNVELTEAIALAHDLGHTPFGHQGERTIDRILKGKIDTINIPLEESNYYGGFKHNFQGLRVANYLEEKYAEYDGLDLSYQVLEGILKHTSCKMKNCEKCEDRDCCEEKCFSLDEFLRQGDMKYLYPEYSFPTTLEGQIVAIADEIAQRSHDLDDAFASGIIDTDQLKNYLSLPKTEMLNDALCKIESSINEIKTSSHRAFVDEDELKHSRIVSEVISFFIKDVIKQSDINMKGFEPNALYNDEHRFSERLIKFSENGSFICDYLEKIISKKVLSSSEVVRFDNMAATVVEKLFAAYYTNPRLLHKGTLRKIYIEMRQVTDKVIDFIEGDRDEVKNELDKIIDPDSKKICPDEKDVYRKKNKILVRAIADYISGMTDSYALNEYHAIYQ